MFSLFLRKQSTDVQEEIFSIHARAAYKNIPAHKAKDESEEKLTIWKKSFMSVVLKQSTCVRTGLTAVCRSRSLMLTVSEWPESIIFGNDSVLGTYIKHSRHLIGNQSWRSHLTNSSRGKASKCVDTCKTPLSYRERTLKGPQGNCSLWLVKGSAKLQTCWGQFMPTSWPEKEWKVFLFLLHIVKLSIQPSTFHF